MLAGNRGLQGQSVEPKMSALRRVLAYEIQRLGMH
jgi:hypothetical protein